MSVEDHVLKGCSLPMKIIHVNFTGSCGGAAIAANRIHRALLLSGIESFCWCARYPAQDERSVCVKHSGWQKIDSIKNVVIQRALRCAKIEGESSINVFPSCLVQQLNASDADVINLHWLNAEMVSIAQLAKINKPVVWTLHDMWAFCGTEHYTDDNRYVDGYSPRNLKLDRQRQRPVQSDGNERSERQTGSLDAEGENRTLMLHAPRSLLSRIDLDRWTFLRKQKYWADWKPQIVTPSCWLAACTQASQLFARLNIDVIPNCVDTDVFKPCVDRVQLRKRHGLPLNKKIILFGTTQISNRRKGGDLLQQALRHIPNKSECVVAVFGTDHIDPLQIDMEAFALGRISGDVALSEIYNLADIMCVPSRQDNLPNTAVEACSCGIPIVAYNTGGLGDIVEHKNNGYLADPFDVEDFASGIAWVLEQEPSFLRNQARSKAMKTFSQEIAAKKYIDVYKRITGVTHE